MSLRQLVTDLLRRVEPDAIAVRGREISMAATAVPCVHGVAGAWMTPVICARCRAVIEASRVAMRTRARAAFEAQFVREVRDELSRRERVRRTRPPRGPSMEDPTR